MIGVVSAGQTSATTQRRAVDETGRSDAAINSAGLDGNGPEPPPYWSIQTAGVEQ